MGSDEALGKSFKTEAGCFEITSYYITYTLCKMSTFTLVLIQPFISNLVTAGSQNRKLPFAL